MITEKRYTYKVFNRNQFISDIPHDIVKSDFHYSQGINEFGARLDIELAATFDSLSPVINADELVDESGNFLVDEQANNLAAYLSYSLLGLTLYIGFYVEVWMVSPDSPTAQKVFSGMIIDWGLKYGGNDVSLIINVISHGMQLKNYIIKDSGATTLNPAYNSVDPSDIVRAAIDQYTQFGGTPDIAYLVDESGNFLVDESANNIVIISGLLTYGPDSVFDTGAAVSYTFHLNTLMEAIQKCLELAPGDWYFYFDPGLGRLYFKPRSQTPDHLFVKGKHIESIELSQNIENMVNDVYYAGGDDGTGSNVLIELADSGSQGIYGQWLSIVNDQRVALTDTAQLLAQGILDRNSLPVFKGSVKVSASDYDIESIMPGQMIMFRGFDDIVNSLFLQIIRIDRTPDDVTLTLNSMLPTTSHRIEDLKRNLAVVNNLNNPNTAS